MWLVRVCFLFRAATGSKVAEFAKSAECALFVPQWVANYELKSVWLTQLISAETCLYQYTPRPVWALCSVILSLFVRKWGQELLPGCGRHVLQNVSLLPPTPLPLPG